MYLQCMLEPHCHPLICNVCETTQQKLTKGGRHVDELLDEQTWEAYTTPDSQVKPKEKAHLLVNYTPPMHQKVCS